MITTVAVAGCRSLRDVVVPLHGLDVVTGANGSGKSKPLPGDAARAECGSGAVIGSLAREGGRPSALWAGPETLGGARRGGYAVEGTRRQGPVSLGGLGFATDDGSATSVDLGLPIPTETKASGLDGGGGRGRLSGAVARPNAVLVDRAGPLVQVRDGREWARSVVAWRPGRAC